MRRLVGMVLGLTVAVNAVAAQDTVTIDFRNYIAGVLDAPVFDMDGVTRLETGQFNVQLLYGKSPVEISFLWAGQPAGFQTGTNAGYWASQQVTLGDVTVGETIWVQVGVWEMIRSGPFPILGAQGRSAVLRIDTTNSVVPLVGLSSFRLPAESLQVRRLDGGMAVEWLHEGASKYDLEAADGLAATNSWISVFTWRGLEGYQTILSVTNPVVSPQRVFRLKRWR